jgi:betaine-aldehyde dehydrogenase
MAQLRALNLIDSQWQGTLGARTGDSVNPASGQEIGSFAAGGRADAQQAIAAARRAFERGAWSHDATLRVRILLGWAERLARRGDLAHLLTLENGKVLAQSRRELAVAIAGLRRHAGQLRYLSGRGGSAPLPGAPAGVAALIVPWHAPLALLVGSLAPALAAGCTAVVKPAPQSAQIVAALIGEFCALEELPAGVVNLVSETGHEVERELVRSSDVDVLCFTGSQETGRKIMRAAGTKKLLLDLAGKSCCVVFADVDMGAVARKLAAAATVAAGQHCSAPRRILVHTSRFDEAKAALRDALGQVVVGAGEQPGCGMGPLIDAPALVAAGVRTEQALDRCDEVILRGGRRGGALANGYFLSPTLVAQRDCAAASTHDDIFGPFVALGQFDADSEALACVNRMCQLHSVSLWTGAPARVQPLVQALHHDRVRINHHNWLAPRAGRALQRGQCPQCALLDFIDMPYEGEPPCKG